MNTSSNVRKAINMNIVTDASEILPSLKPTSTNNFNFRKERMKFPCPLPSNSPLNYSNVKTTSTFNIQPYTEIKPAPVEKLPISKRHSITDMLVSEWIDPSNFLEISTGGSINYLSNTSSPLAIVSGTQAALFNMAVIDEDDRILRMRHKMKILQQTMPNVLGPLRVDFINVQKEKEPAFLPSPLKEEEVYGHNGNNLQKGLRDPNCMVSLPPIFNHTI